VKLALLIAGRVLLSALLVCAAPVAAMWIAFDINDRYCGSQLTAPGEGAAIGMFVFFFIGIPSALLCLTSEIVFNFVRVSATSLAIRAAVLLLPAMASALFTNLAASRECGGEGGPQWFGQNLHRSHVEGNVPAPGEFHAILHGSLDAYFSDWLKKKVHVEYQLLRDEPTQSGLSYPKYFAWVRIFDGNRLQDEGAVTLAAMDRTGFAVVEYTSAVTIRFSPEVARHTYPRALVPAILRKAGARR
jgi:hypothetical protein